MRYLSVCSGIEAASVAWEPLGWKAAAFSEIEAFPRAVLAHRFPTVPLHGDFTTIKGDEYGPVDLLVGGTPCQSFSVAGLRGGLDDDRGNLALEYLRLADRARPRWLVWENVPGVLSSNGGRDFGAILGGMVELGYGVAYRVLDAQFFGVPQRRRRVFVVGYLGDWRCAAAVLFERHSLSGHPAPRREKGQSAPTIPSRGSAGGGLGTDFDCDGGLISAHRMTAFGEYSDDGTASALKARDFKDALDLVAHSLRAEGFDASEDGTGRGTPLVPVAAIQERAISENPDAGPDGAGFRTDGKAYTLEARTVPQAIAFDTTQITSAANYSNPKEGDPCHPLARGMHPPAVAFTASDQANSYAWEREVYPTLNAQIPNDTSNIQQGVRLGSAVRRLTPRECERLQGFPDDFTLVPYRGKPAADGPRYKAIGNSMAVPVVRWIGERISAVEAIAAESAAA